MIAVDARKKRVADLLHCDKTRTQSTLLEIDASTPASRVNARRFISSQRLRDVCFVARPRGRETRPLSRTPDPSCSLYCSDPALGCRRASLETAPAGPRRRKSQRLEKRTRASAPLEKAPRSNGRWARARISLCFYSLPLLPQIGTSPARPFMTSRTTPGATTRTARRTLLSY